MLFLSVICSLWMALGHFTAGVLTQTVQMALTTPQPILPLFSACNPNAEKSECGYNAVCGTALPGSGLCARGICMCASPEFAPLYMNATDCGRLLKLGDVCSSNGDSAMLIPEFAQCQEDMVMCAMGLTAVNDTCVAPDSMQSLPGEPCSEKVACNGALQLECSRLGPAGRHCQCISNLIFKDGRCQPAMFGDPCTNDDQCNVIYGELPGASRGVCRNFTCDCGEHYVQVPAVVRSSPSTNLLADMRPSNILGYYCFPNYVLGSMTAGEGENCSMPLPREPFSVANVFCSENLVCIHCTELGSLTRGICGNLTVLMALEATTAPMTTLEPTTEVPAKNETVNPTSAPQSGSASFHCQNISLAFKLTTSLAVTILALIYQQL